MTSQPPDAGSAGLWISISRFSHNFRQRYGMSPSALRQGRGLDMGFDVRNGDETARSHWHIRWLMAEDPAHPITMTASVQ